MPEVPFSGLGGQRSLSGDLAEAPLLSGSTGVPEVPFRGLGGQRSLSGDLAEAPLLSGSNGVPEVPFRGLGGQRSLSGDLAEALLSGSIDVPETFQRALGRDPIGELANTWSTDGARSEHLRPRRSKRPGSRSQGAYLRYIVEASDRHGQRTHRASVEAWR